MTAEVVAGSEAEERREAARACAERIRTASAPPGSGPLLVFVNPFGGSGRGRHIWEVVVRPMLQQSATPFNLVITERAGHAQDMVSGAEKDTLLDLRAIMVVGGDGMLYEVVQGLQARADSAEIFARLPFGLICAGSGNGLCKSILFESGEVYDPLSATFVVMKGKSRPKDLSLVQTPSQNQVSFLCLGANRTSPQSRPPLYPSACKCQAGPSSVTSTLNRKDTGA